VSSSISPDDFRAAAETHNELGPEYQNAVIESFLDKVGREIDARVDARMGQGPRPGFIPAPRHPIQAPQQHEHHSHGASWVVPVASIVLGIPLTAIAAAAGTHPAGVMGVLVVWLALVAINVAYALSRRPR
jgi:hypothetical protein